VRTELIVSVQIFSVAIVVHILTLCLLFIGDTEQVVWTLIYTQIEIAMLPMLWLASIYPQRTEEQNAPVALTPDGKPLTWAQVVATQNGYEAFANFLQREFSVENILFVTEVVQLKRAVRGETEASEKSHGSRTRTYSGAATATSSGMHIRLPSSRPRA